MFDLKLDAIHELTSQAYEGGADGSEASLAKVPAATDVAGRKAWLRKQWEGRQRSEAERSREALIKMYGQEKGAAVKFAEAFEICEYGRQPSPEEIRKLFPFFD